MAFKRKKSSWTGWAQKYPCCVPERVTIHSLYARRRWVTQGFLRMFVLSSVFSSKQRFILICQSRHTDVQLKGTLLRGCTAFIVLTLFPFGKLA